jgi:very-short-patch-repair endonuclease
MGPQTCLMSEEAGTPGPTSGSRGRRARARSESGTAGTCRVRVLGVRSEVAVSGTRDERIVQVAHLQRGRVARRQLLAAGISSSAIARLVGGHRLIPVFRGVFAVGHAAHTELGDETAALLAVGDAALLGYESAARLCGLLPRNDRRIHIVNPTRGPVLPGVRVHRSHTLTRRDVRVLNGLPLTSPARALLDVAADLSDRQLELAFDRGIVDRLFRAGDVADVVRRNRGRRGASRLHALLDAQRPTTVTRSEAEERVPALIRGAQLPEPVINARVHGYEVDFYWPAYGLVLEVDGFRYHSTRRAFEHDRRKDNDLRAAGLNTMRVTWRQITDEPLAVVARLAQALTHPAPQASDPPGRPRASCAPRSAAAR